MTYRIEELKDGIWHQIGDYEFHTLEKAKAKVRSLWIRGDICSLEPGWFRITCSSWVGYEILNNITRTEKLMWKFITTSDRKWLS